MFHFISTDQLTLGLIHHSKQNKFFSPALQPLSALLTEFDEAMTWEITAEENIQNSPQPPITSSPDKLCLIRFFSFATSDRQTHNLKFPEIWYYFEYSGCQEALSPTEAASKLSLKTDLIHNAPILACSKMTYFEKSTSYFLKQRNFSNHLDCPVAFAGINIFNSKSAIFAMRYISISIALWAIFFRLQKKDICNNFNFHTTCEKTLYIICAIYNLSSSWHKSMSSVTLLIFSFRSVWLSLMHKSFERITTNANLQRMSFTFSKFSSVLESVLSAKSLWCL